MNENKEAYGLAYKSTPPYEVLFTRWLSYEDILRLKGIEEMVELYYNSGQFTETLAALDESFPDAFEMYDRLARFYAGQGFHRMNHARTARYEILLQFVEWEMPEKASVIRELLTYDYYLRENAGNRPAFAGEYRMEKDEVRAFYEAEAKEHKYLPGYKDRDRNQMRKMTHLEHFEILGRTVLFDYSRRSPLTKDARTVIIAK